MLFLCTTDCLLQGPNVRGVNLRARMGQYYEFDFDITSVSPYFQPAQPQGPPAIAVASEREAIPVAAQESATPWDDLSLSELKAAVGERGLAPGRSRKDCIAALVEADM